MSKFVDNDRETTFPREIYRLDLFTLQFWAG
ncbi:hypothetical protein HNR40_007445 [Nonomuraea endophytica]|uniref:Uncharacterized protein n=1 Tax=Nonomuraea endophytica TaxID=714136 RepID=A0A7W8AB32_9ACTN|nr:hypothetical protein [Nonomuraea endophytica]